ncbi:MAG: aromatic ring-hydroxylating dioxygenase subunit alpha [Nostocaceae cyanobacterium]|nr:aromatic ring-hydroxylating dioxygenase subunit alpha [Nostocaceae cyanobacterium]
MVLSPQTPQTELSNLPTLETAFPIAWYAIAASDSVRSQPLGIRRLGIDLVLWRDSDGKIVCQSRHCPHRGVDLALGKISHSDDKSCLECPYHGFQFAVDGQCIFMPCEGQGARISRLMRVKSYRVQESHGLIWLWWGDEETTTWEIPWFTELSDRPRRWADAEMVWDVHFTRAVESALIDIHHFAFAHRSIAKWSGIGTAKRLDTLDTQAIGNQIKTQGILKGEGKDGPSIRFKNEVLFPNLSVFDFGLGGIKLFVTVTPIDEDNTWINFRYYVPFGLPNLSRLIAKIAVWFELNFVQPDDYRLVKSIVPKCSGLKENQFVHADRTIVHWHRLNKHHQQKAISKKLPL